MKGKRSYAIGAALFAGAFTFHWWPPELKKQGSELAVAAVGTAIITLRLAIKDVLAKLIAELAGSQAGTGTAPAGDAEAPKPPQN